MISETAAVEWVDRGYLGGISQLTLPAPGTVEAILDGRHPRAGIAGVLGAVPGRLGAAENG